MELGGSWGWLVPPVPRADRVEPGEIVSEPVPAVLAAVVVSQRRVLVGIGGVKGASPWIWWKEPRGCLLVEEPAFGGNLGCSKAMCPRGTVRMGGSWDSRVASGRSLISSKVFGFLCLFLPRYSLCKTGERALQLGGCFLTAVAEIVGLSATWR